MNTPTLKSRLLEEFEKLLSGRLSLLLGDSLAIARSKRAFLAGAKCALEIGAEQLESIPRANDRLRTLSKSLGEE